MHHCDRSYVDTLVVKDRLSVWKLYKHDPLMTKCSQTLVYDKFLFLNFFLLHNFCLDHAFLSPATHRIGSYTFHCGSLWYGLGPSVCTSYSTKYDIHGIIMNQLDVWGSYCLMKYFSQLQVLEKKSFSPHIIFKTKSTVVWSTVCLGRTSLRLLLNNV